MFQQSQRGGGHGGSGAPEFRALAERTGGAYFAYNPKIEGIAQKLPSLLKAVTHYALGATQALEEIEDQSVASSMLDQMSKKELQKPRA